MMPEVPPLKLNILAVDDDRRMRSVLKSLLAEEGHEVATSSDGLEAIAQCRETAFDLVITDLMMPGASGIEVLKACRQSYPDTLVVLITGFASLETAIEAIREGAYDYITKPFKMDEMKIVVKNAGEQIRLQRENRRLLEELKEAYEQIRIVKKIMGATSSDETPEDAAAESAARKEPLIAGSMLSHSYVESGFGGRQALLSDLERIASLRDKGFLSDEEFELCKAKLLHNLKP
ncbi:MAG: response regulator [Desulfobacteraceae bacterium]|jgi:DNA-binding NtrC family response regulator